MSASIKAVEVWAPLRGTLELGYVAGNYGTLAAFKEISEKRRFRFGHGLPGKAWAQGRPLRMDARDPYFERGGAAQEAGVTTAIALPIFTGDYLTGVLVFLCGEAPECVGAIEIWHCDTQESHDLTLFDGYFGCLDRFRAIAERTSLRPGTGLPGLVWQSGMPVLMRDLGRTHAFIRYEGALEAGITMGLGFPVFHDPTQVFLVTLLFARGTPFARRIEVWVVDEKRESLTFLNGYSDRGVDLARQYANIHVRIAEGPLGRVLLTGVPAVCGLEFPWISAREDGLKHLVCIPVIEAGRCKAIVVLFS